MKNTTTKTENLLQLRKCAYIFDDFHGFKYGTRETIAQQTATENALKEYYESEEKRAEWIPYEIETVKSWNGEQITRLYITINGTRHGLNALQVQRVKGEAETTEAGQAINNRAEISLKAFPEEIPETGARLFCRESLLYNGLKSLEVENFTSADDIGFIRVNFNGRNVRVIVTKSCEFYNADGIQHTKTTKAEIIARLNAKSAKAKKAIGATLDKISETAKA